MIVPRFNRRERKLAPFPHVRADDVISDELAGAVLAWLDDDAPWSFTKADFYEQNEFSLLAVDVPSPVAPLVATTFVEAVAAELAASLDAGKLELVDVNVHRLLPGMTIRLHNDFLGDEAETHRMLIQLNHGWSAERGGLLMLFDDDKPESLADVLMPVHRSAFGFEISARSHHAVSTVHAGNRDTIVYTFRQAS